MLIESEEVMGQGQRFVGVGRGLDNSNAVRVKE